MGTVCGAASHERVPIDQVAIYTRSQQIFSKTKAEGKGVILESEQKRKIMILRPEGLESVPMEFFIYYEFNPDLPLKTQQDKLIRIAQHIRNFHRDAIYREAFDGRLDKLLVDKNLNGYRIYLLFVYVLKLDDAMEANEAARKSHLSQNEEALKREEAKETLRVLSGLGENEDVAHSLKFSQKADMHLRRAQYAFWALKALSEITLNLSSFSISEKEIRGLLMGALADLNLASTACLEESQHFDALRVLPEGTEALVEELAHLSLEPEEVNRVAAEYGPLLFELARHPLVREVAVRALEVENPGFPEEMARKHREISRRLIGEFSVKPDTVTELLKTIKAVPMALRISKAYATRGELFRVFMAEFYHAKNFQPVAEKSYRFLQELLTHRWHVDQEQIILD